LKIARRLENRQKPQTAQNRKITRLDCVFNQVVSRILPSILGEPKAAGTALVQKGVAHARPLQRVAHLSSPVKAWQNDESSELSFFRLSGAGANAALFERRHAVGDSDGHRFA
jgi:hypothetical protein